MYYGFFGLSQPPFKITPDTGMFFEGGNRGAILEALIYAICQGEGIIKVTGEVGSGKTMLCRMLQTRLPENVETIYLANPSVSPDEILHAVAFEMQLPVAKDASRIEVMHTLNDYLLEQHAQGKQVVLFVEESQSMPLATLEEVRLLSNLETNHHKLLQIVLFGQPEFDRNLQLPEIRQLRERITHSFSLLPFTVADVHPYLAFRLRAAGYRGPDLFTGRVVDYISRISAGLTRRVNIISDKTLLAAFADGTHNISLKHVKAAVRDSEFASSAPPQRNRSPIVYIVLGALIGGAIGLGSLTALQQFQQGNEPGTDTIVGTAPSNNTVLARPHSEPDVIGEQPIQVQVVNNSTMPASEAPNEPIPVTFDSPDTAETEAPPQPELWESPNPLAQRLRETEHWLATAERNRFTIQLLGSFDPDLLNQELKNLSEYVELERIFVYRTVANRRQSFTVLLGTYPTRTEAIRDIDTLPEYIRVNRPYVRTVRGVRAEIARVTNASVRAAADDEREY